MGNCTAKRSNKASRNYASSIKVSVPNLSYISRREKTLLSVISSEIKLIKLKGKLKLNRASSISPLDDGSIIIAGGLDSTSSLISSVFLINPLEKTTLELPQLPVPVKFGRFLKHMHYLYYIGGTTEADDHDSSMIEAGAPLMRLSLQDNSWEVFKNKHASNPSTYVQRKIISEEEKARISMFVNKNIRLKDIVEPGVVLHNGRIYLLGGRIIKDKRMECSEKVFSLSLAEESFEIREEDVTLPIKLFATSCTLRRNLVVIAGGYGADMAPNCEVFVFDFTSHAFRKMNLAVDRPLEDHYPIFMDEKGILCFSPPKLLYIREDKQKIYTFSIPSGDSVKAEEIHSLGKSRDSKEVKQKLVDLSINFSERARNLASNEEFFLINSARHSQRPSEHTEMAEEVEVKNEIIENKINVSESWAESKTKEEQLPEEQENEEEKKLFCDNGCTMQFNDMDEGKGNKNCSHCYEVLSENFWICEKCQFLACEKCADGLRQSKRLLSPYVQCRKGHLFCKEYVENVERLTVCSNCHEMMSCSLVCFICNKYICGKCEKVLEDLAKADCTCPELHDFVWVFRRNLKKKVKCDACFKKIREIGLFHCEVCAVYVCLECVHAQVMNPGTQMLVKSNSFQEKPTNLSKSLQKIQGNKGDDPEDIVKRVEEVRKIVKKLEIDIKTQSKIEGIEDLKKKVGDEEGIIKKNEEENLEKVDNAEGKVKEAAVVPLFVTPIAEIQKKIIKKPLRGEKSSFLLNLSPKKEEENIEKALTNRRSLENDQTFSIELRKNPEFIDKRANTINFDGLSVNLINSEEKAKEKEETKEKFIESQYINQKIKENHSNDSVSDIKNAECTPESSEKSSPRLPISESSAKNPELSEKVIDTSSLPQEILLTPVEILQVPSPHSKNPSADSNFYEETAFPQKLDSFSSTELRKGRQEVEVYHENPELQENFIEIKFSQVELSDQSMNFSESIPKTLVFPDPKEELSENLKENEGNLNEIKENTGIFDKIKAEDTSYYFTTLGDDNENLVAPRIGGTLAADKINALKAKILMLKSDESESSFNESENQGFAIGNISVSYSSVSESTSYRKTRDDQDYLRGKNSDQKEEIGKMEESFEEEDEEVKQIYRNSEEIDRNRYGEMGSEEEQRKNSGEKVSSSEISNRKREEDSENAGKMGEYNEKAKKDRKTKESHLGEIDDSELRNFENAGRFDHKNSSSATEQSAHRKASSVSSASHPSASESLKNPTNLQFPEKSAQESLKHSRKSSTIEEEERENTYENSKTAPVDYITIRETVENSRKGSAISVLSGIESVKVENTEHSDDAKKSLYKQEKKKYMKKIKISDSESQDSYKGEDNPGKNKSKSNKASNKYSSSLVKDSQTVTNNKKDTKIHTNSSRDSSKSSNNLRIPIKPAKKSNNTGKNSEKAGYISSSSSGSSSLSSSYERESSNKSASESSSGSYAIGE